MLNKCVDILIEESKQNEDLVNVLKTLSKEDLMTFKFNIHKSRGYSLLHLLAFNSNEPWLREFKDVTGSGVFSFVTVEDIIEYRLSGSKPCYTAIAVLNDEGKLLVQDHIKRSALAPVGGMIEVGETPIDGFYRELFEEAGLNKEDVKLLSVGTLTSETYDAKIFWCRLVGSALPFNKEAHKHKSQWFESIDVLKQLSDNNLTLTLRTIVADYDTIVSSGLI